MISFDLETEPMAPGRQAPRPVLAQAVGFSSGPDVLAHGSAFACKPSGHTFKALTAAFAREGGVGQNLAFDLGVLVEHGWTSVEQVFDGFDRGVYRSVDIRQKLLDIAEGCYYWRKYNLGEVAARYGIEGVDKANPWRTRFAELEHVPWAQWPADATQYALADVESPLIIFAAQERERARIWSDAGADPLADETRASKAIWALRLVASHGIVPDKEALDYYRAWVESRQRDARKVLLQSKLVYLSAGVYKKRTKVMRGLVERAWTERTGRWKSLGAWLHHRGESVESFKERTGLDSFALEQILDDLPMRGLEAMKAKIVSDATEGEVVPYPRTESGKYPMLDEPTAEALDLPELRAWLEYGSSVSAASRYQELAGVSPVHTHFDLAESGRSRSASPNTQNRNRTGPDRECFAPAVRHGRLGGDLSRQLVYLVTDHDQLELSTVAQVLVSFGCGDNLARAINAGIDGHLSLTAEILQISYDEAKRRHLAGDKEVKRWRTVAKAANFGFAGGLGVAGFMAFALQIYGVRVSLEDAQRVRAAWFSRWPEFRAYFRLIGSATRSGPATIRQLYSNRLRGGIGFTDGCNTLFQGLGGDLTTDVLYELQRDTRRAPIVDLRAIIEAFEYERGQRGAVTIEHLAGLVGCQPRDATNALLHGARIENYVHDEYLLAVWYHPRREGCLVVDPLLEARALAKEHVIRTVSERWLPDMHPTATASACARWSKAARDVRDEHGRPIVWDVCDDVDELAYALGDVERETKAGPWARAVCDAARPWSDDAGFRRALDARLTGLVPGYRKTPDLALAHVAVHETAKVLDLTPF